MKTSQQIRQEFISFFEERQHRFVRSSPVVPNDDPTLLFANAGIQKLSSLFDLKDEDVAAIIDINLKRVIH